MVTRPLTAVRLAPTGVVEPLGLESGEGVTRHVKRVMASAGAVGAMGFLMALLAAPVKW